VSSFIKVEEKEITRLESVTDSRNLGLRRANRNCMGTNNGGLAAINPKE
jgi:hypothetical protein